MATATGRGVNHIPVPVRRRVAVDRLLPALHLPPALHRRLALKPVSVRRQLTIPPWCSDRPSGLLVRRWFTERLIKREPPCFRFVLGVPQQQVGELFDGWLR